MAGVLLLIALAGACGTTSGSYGAAASTAPAVRVSLVEFRITPSVTSVPAGPVTFVVSNQGAVTHEMVIVQTDSAPDRLKLSADVAPGKSATETFRLKSGHYVLFCNQPGHYRMGMATALNVT